MTTDTSATAQVQTPHETETVTISDALKRRAQAVIKRQLDNGMARVLPLQFSSGIRGGLGELGATPVQVLGHDI